MQLYAFFLNAAASLHRINHGGGGGGEGCNSNLCFLLPMVSFLLNYFLLSILHTPEI